MSIYLYNWYYNNFTILKFQKKLSNLIMQIKIHIDLPFKVHVKNHRIENYKRKFMKFNILYKII